MPLVRSIFAFALLLCTMAPLAAQAAPDRDLDAVYVAFRAAYAQLDADAVTGLYTDDALYLAAGQSPKRGRAQIRPVFVAFFDMIRRDGGTLAIDFRIVRREATPALASDVGYYRLAVVRDGVRGKASYGRFVTVSRQDGDGRFRFVVDSYTEADAAEWEATPPRDP